MGCEARAAYSGSQLILPSTGGTLAFSRKFDGSKFTSEELDYYVTGRWPYARWYWDGKSTTKGTAFSAADYPGRKVLLYSVEKRKAIVGIIAESGPGPWTGVPKNRRSIEGLFWNIGPLGLAPRSDVPVGNAYHGRVTGAPLTLLKKLGFTGSECETDKGGSDANNSPFIIGFLKDQSKYKVGQVLEAPDLKKMDEGLIPAKNGSLAVPGIAEGRQSQCGIASIASVATYYFSLNGRPKYEDLPADLRRILNNKSVGGSLFTTDPDISASECVSPGFLNGLPLKREGQNIDGWTYATVRKAQDYSWAVASIRSGDPVIIYSAPGSAFSNSKHIYVLTGWIDQSQEFVVNNPFPNGVNVSVRGSQLQVNKAQTFDHLFAHNGNGIYGHTLIIRSKYVK